MSFEYPSVVSAAMLPMREKILMMGLVDTAEAVLEVNLTKDKILGDPTEIINGQSEKIFERHDLPRDCSFTYFVKYFRGLLPKEEIAAYDEFFDLGRMQAAYHKGELVQKHAYWINLLPGYATYIEQRIVLYQDPATQDIYAICFAKDTTELRRENQNGSMAEMESHIDHLTQVFNRRKLEAFAKECLADSSNTGAFILVDVDHFKELNDAMGHGFGDTVLVEVAALMKNSLMTGDIVARLGGDEFVIFVPNIYNKRIMKSKLSLLLSQAYKTVLSNKQETLEISLSVGVALFPQDATTYEDLYAKADEALYLAKHLGRNRYMLYEEITDELAGQILSKAAMHLQRTSSTLRDTDCRAILDSFRSTAVYIISEEGHRLLYVNKLISDRVPDLRLGSVCHEVWAGYCGSCPLKFLGNKQSARVISHYNPFGRTMEISATRMLWRNSIPAIIVRLYPHYEETD